MSLSPLLGGRRPPRRADGRDPDALGPSDSSDSGSDTVGGSDRGLSDRAGTGERATASGHDPEANADLLPDHLIRRDGVGAAGTDGVEPDGKDEGDDDVEWRPPQPDVRTPTTVADEVRGLADEDLARGGNGPGR